MKKRGEKKGGKGKRGRTGKVPKFICKNKMLALGVSSFSASRTQCFPHPFLYQTILWYKKSMLGFEMTKFSSNCTQIQIVGLFWGWQLFTNIRRRKQNFQDSATQGKIAIIVEQSSPPGTYNCQICPHTNPRPWSQPARSVTTTRFCVTKNLVVVFPFWLSLHSPCSLLPSVHPPIYTENL